MLDKCLDQDEDMPKLVTARGIIASNKSATVYRNHTVSYYTDTTLQGFPNHNMFSIEFCKTIRL